MSKEYKGELLRNRKKGELLKDKPLGEGDLIVSEGPKGEPLWKKKKKLNEKGEKEIRPINE